MRCRRSWGGFGRCLSGRWSESSRLERGASAPFSFGELGGQYWNGFVGIFARLGEALFHDWASGK